MDLLCCESGIEIECRAYVDPVLLNDDRVLLNMLAQEEKYTPTTPYFSCVQKDVTPQMRTIVSNWMLEVRFTTCSCPGRPDTAARTPVRSLPVPRKASRTWAASRKTVVCCWWPGRTEPCACGVRFAACVSSMGMSVPGKVELWSRSAGLSAHGVGSGLMG